MTISAHPGAIFTITGKVRPACQLEHSMRQAARSENVKERPSWVLSPAMLRIVASATPWPERDAAGAPAHDATLARPAGGSPHAAAVPPTRSATQHAAVRLAAPCGKRRSL